MEWHQVCKTAPSPRPARPPKALTSTSGDRRSCRVRSWTGKWWMRGWSLASKVPSPPQTRSSHRPRGLHGKVSNKKRKQGRFFVFIRYDCLTHPHKCTACRPPRSCKSGWECCTSARPMGSSRSFCFPGANTDIQCEETGRTRECVSGRREEEDVFLRQPAAHGALPVLGLTGTRLLAEGSSLRSPASLREGKPPGEGRPSCSRSSSSSSSSLSLRGSVCLLLVLSSMLPIASILAPVIFDDFSMILFFFFRGIWKARTVIYSPSGVLSPRHSDQERENRGSWGWDGYPATRSFYIR